MLEEQVVYLGYPISDFARHVTNCGMRPDINILSLSVYKQF